MNDISQKSVVKNAKDFSMVKQMRMENSSVLLAMDIMDDQLKKILSIYHGGQNIL